MPVFVYRIHPPLGDGAKEDVRQAGDVEFYAPRLTREQLKAVNEMVTTNGKVPSTLDHHGNVENVRSAQTFAHEAGTNHKNFFHGIDWTALTHTHLPAIGRVVKIIEPESDVDFWRAAVEVPDEVADLIANGRLHGASMTESRYDESPESTYMPQLALCEDPARPGCYLDYPHTVRYRAEHGLEQPVRASPELETFSREHDSGITPGESHTYQSAYQPISMASSTQSTPMETAQTNAAVDPQQQAAAAAAAAAASQPPPPRRATLELPEEVDPEEAKEYVAFMARSKKRRTELAKRKAGDAFGEIVDGLPADKREMMLRLQEASIRKLEREKAEKEELLKRNKAFEERAAQEAIAGAQAFNEVATRVLGDGYNESKRAAMQAMVNDIYKNPLNAPVFHEIMCNAAQSMQARPAAVPGQSRLPVPGQNTAPVPGQAAASRVTTEEEMYKRWYDPAAHAAALNSRGMTTHYAPLIGESEAAIVDPTEMQRRMQERMNALLEGDDF